jgi:hypothetical protein
MISEMAPNCMLHCVCSIPPNPKKLSAQFYSLLLPQLLVGRHGLTVSFQHRLTPEVIATDTARSGDAFSVIIDIF